MLLSIEPKRETINVDYDGNFRLIMYSSTVWWQCQKYIISTRRTTGGSGNFPSYKGRYGDRRNSKVGRFSAIKGFRSWMPRRCPEGGISHLIIYVQSRQCFRATSTGRRSTAKLRISCIMHPYTTRLVLYDPSRIPKRTVYVCHRDI